MANANGDDWFRCLRPNPEAGLRLICYPHAGGGSAAYHNWPCRLTPEVEVCVAQLPGRENRIAEPPFKRLAPLVEAHARGLGASAHKPFALFGHSMGALLCFELARQLRRQGAPLPVRLFLSGFRAPHLQDPDPPIHGLAEAEFVSELRRINGTPEEVLADPELLRLLLPAVRADFELCETYSYTDEEPLSCPVTVFGGLEDDRVSRDQLAATSIHTEGPFRLRMLPGDHFFIYGSQPLLLELLSQELSDALGPPARRAS